MGQRPKVRMLYIGVTFGGKMSEGSWLVTTLKDSPKRRKAWRLAPESCGNSRFSPTVSRSIM